MPFTDPKDPIGHLGGLTGMAKGHLWKQIWPSIAMCTDALMLLCVCTVIYSLARPDPIICRGAIAFSISVYTANNNASMQTRVWPYESTVACLCPLHYHMGTTILLLLHCYQNFQYLCSTIHLMSTNSASADNATSEYQVQIIGYISYLKLR